MLFSTKVHQICEKTVLDRTTLMFLKSIFSLNLDFSDGYLQLYDGTSIESPIEFFGWDDNYPPKYVFSKSNEVLIHFYKEGDGKFKLEYHPGSKFMKYKISLCTLCSFSGDYHFLIRSFSSF